MKITISQEGVGPISVITVPDNNKQVTKSQEGFLDKMKESKYDFWNEESFNRWLESKKSDFGKICNMCIRIQKDKEVKGANKIRYGNYLALDYDYGKTFVSSAYIEKIIRGLYKNDMKRKKGNVDPILIVYMDTSDEKEKQSFFEKYKEIFLNSQFKTDWERPGNSFWDYIEKAVKNREDACGFCVYI